MNNLILHGLDIFFLVFHTVFILFNLFGWLAPCLRLLNFISLSLTAFSWYVLGIWYGWGYCIFTDWHWKLRNMLGYNDTSESYIHFLIYHLTGFNLNQTLVDRVTIIAFFSVYALSIYFMIKKWRLAIRQKKE